MVKKMSKRKSTLDKSTKIQENSKALQWAYVDTDNEFVFMDKTFVISEKVEEYRVYNKAGLIEDYTNECYMDKILVVLDKNDKLNFFNQKYDKIDNKYITVKGE